MAIGALTALLAAGAAVIPAAAADMAGTFPRVALDEAAESGEAPTEELAKAAAKASGQLVEVTSQRQERREVFANPDGSFTSREYAQPVRTRRDNSWVPVDDSLVKRSDGGWSPKAATVDVEFSGGGQGPFARMNRVGREYALTWPGGALPQPTVEGNTARYDEVLPGVDLAVRADVEGFAHYLIVKTAEAAANPELDQIELGLSTKGLNVSETTDGALKAVDSAVGGTVFESGRAMMWDTAVAPADTRATLMAEEQPSTPEAELNAADGGRKAPVGLDVAKGKITLTPDPKLLRGQDTVYPVVIDPIPRTTGTTAWTSVMSGMPNEQNWKYSGHAGMGKCPSNYNPTECSGIGVRRLLFSFPMSFYSGKQILSTTFSARIGAVYWADASAEPVDLYRIGGQNYTVNSSSNWSNTQDDWSDYLMTVDQKISPTTCTSGANLHFSNGELLDEAKAAAAGGWSSMSLGLKAKDESTYYGWKRICGNSYLSVTYNTPPLQVSNALMSSTPGGKCVVDATKAPYVDVLPQLRGEARDPDHTTSYTDQVKMQYQVFYRDAGNVERNYFSETPYKSPNSGTVFSHQVTQPTAGSGIGMYDPVGKKVFQRTSPSAGPNTAEINFDAAGRTVLVGDWNGDGVDTLGTFDPATRDFVLRDKNEGPDNPSIRYGTAGDIPVVGDWNGDGRDTIGVWRPSNHYFYLNNELSNTFTDIQFVYGATGMTPIIGDWNGDGVDTIGMYDGPNIMFYLRNYNSAGGNNHEIRYGSVGDKPVVGDWNQDKTDTIGVWHPSNHYFYLNNEHSNNIADLSFVYGAGGMTALAGTWIPGIPATTTISWQARAFDGEAWGPWSSANGAGRCVVRRDATVPAMPVVTGNPYKDDNAWRSGIGTEGTFTFDAVDGDVVGYRYNFDDETAKTIGTTGGNPVTVKWTPMSSGRHSVFVEAYDGAGNAGARATYEFLVHDGRVGQWNLGDLAGATDAHDETARHSATPGPGVTFAAEGPGGKVDGAARFDGTAGAYLDAGEAIVDTTSSFSVSAWVKPTALDRDMAVVSQDGNDEAGFDLGYDASTNGWVFAAPDADGEATTRWQAKAVEAPQLNTWVHLTGVFDARAAGGPQLRIHVNNGAPTTAARPVSWAATGGFQIGRAISKGVYGENFQGDLSEIRAYNRPVTASEINAFQTLKPIRKSYWQFEKATDEGTVVNVESSGQPLRVYNASFYQQLDILDPAALSGTGHMELDGVDDWAQTEAPVVGADKSYTVAMRARLTSLDPAKSQTVLSLPGQNADRLIVRYQAATQRWELVVTGADSTTAKKIVVSDLDTLPVLDGSGSHLAVTYDAVTQQVRLYVNGNNVSTAVGVDDSPWSSSGGLQVGRATKTGTGEYFAGAIDEVRVYDGVLDQVGIELVNNQTPEGNL